MVHDEVLKRVDSENLAVLAVWMPVLHTDNAAAALEAEGLMPDDRVLHYWDDANRLGRLYPDIVTLPRGRALAWDIYFVYGPGVKWEDRPPAPSYWMHQLAGDDRRLDGDRLRAAIEELLPAAAAAD